MDEQDKSQACRLDWEVKMISQKVALANQLECHLHEKCTDRFMKPSGIEVGSKELSCRDKK